jgi:hypothetical protein
LDCSWAANKLEELALKHFINNGVSSVVARYVVDQKQRLINLNARCGLSFNQFLAVWTALCDSPKLPTRDRLSALKCQVKKIRAGNPHLGALCLLIAIKSDHYQFVEVTVKRLETIKAELTDEEKVDCLLSARNTETLKLLLEKGLGQDQGGNSLFTQIATAIENEQFTLAGTASTLDKEVIMSHFKDHGLAIL